MLQEVKALERLQHPNIVSYKHSWLERTKPADFGPDNIPTLFILTEYANAGNLHDFIFYNPNRSVPPRVPCACACAVVRVRVRWCVCVCV